MRQAQWNILIKELKIEEAEEWKQKKNWKAFWTLGNNKIILTDKINSMEINSRIDLSEILESDWRQGNETW